jgi:hypothetical protein
MDTNLKKRKRRRRRRRVFWVKGDASPFLRRGPSTYHLPSS